MRPLRILISGGGTGGHVYPAIAIADAIRKKNPGAEILFIGAEGRLEMEKVPLAGYRIEGLPVVGFQRKLTWRNLLFPFRLAASWWKARRLIRTFRPDAAVGVGGYASGPALQVAVGRGVPSVLQEQNAFPGLTNRLLARKATRICVAYEGMDRYFPKEKILLTGNPVRADLLTGLEKKRRGAIEMFDLHPDRKTVLLFGGSLGARTLNAAMMSATQWLQGRPDVQWIWQTGHYYEQECASSGSAKLDHVHAMPFIDRMDMVYAAADLVIGRAGALTIAELCLVGKPAILVPSPNVAEDHQTRNALALVQQGAARMITDADAAQRLVPEALALLTDAGECRTLASNIRRLARPRAADEIADVVLRLAEAHRNDLHHAP